MTSYYHHTATTDAQHAMCPDGETSWCTVKRARQKNKILAAHKEKNLLLANKSYENLKLVRSVYIDLSKSELLQNYMKERPQNPYEEFVLQSLEKSVKRQMLWPAEGDIFQSSPSCSRTSATATPIS